MGIGLGCLGAIFFFSLIFILPVEQGSWFILLFILASLTSLIVGGRYDSKRKLDFTDNLFKRLKEMAKRIDDFNVTQEFISPNLESYIALDEDNKKVCIIENEHKNHGELSKTTSKFEYKHYVYSFNEIIQSEIISDGVTINKTSRSSQIGGALVGGALAGGIGAVIGGLGTSSESKSTVTNLELQVVVDNAKNSVHRVIFMSPHDLGKYITNNEEKEIAHWHNLLTHIINRTNESISSDINSSPISMSDEIRKLSELYKDGILTEEEFNEQKTKLLSS
jgi:hypothetical protein